MLAISNDAANRVRTLHAKYFGTCADNAVYTGMEDVDYDNLVVSISEMDCSVSFSAKAEKRTSFAYPLSNSTTTTSIADFSVREASQSLAQVTNLSPLSSDESSHRGDLSSANGTVERRLDDSKLCLETSPPVAVAIRLPDQAASAYQLKLPDSVTNVDQLRTSAAPAPVGFLTSVALVQRCASCIRVLRIGYVTSFTLFILCVLQTYSIFGAFGSNLFDSVQLANMNSWITFQTIHR